MKRKTISVDLPVQIPKEFSEIAKAFAQALLIIRSLYESQLSGDLSRRQEKTLWDGIPIQLKSAGIAEVYLHDLVSGIYDLYPITASSNDNEIDLIVGKVFTSEGDSESYYSGVVGIVDDCYKSVLESFDTKLSELCELLSANFEDEKGSIKDKAPEIRCLDVFSLAGALNLQHKPICVFFSGENKESISTLSNMTVFINLYTARFKAITLDLARRYMCDAAMFDRLSDHRISDLLLIWLRGHDVGHFIGEDKLGERVSQFDKDYMILHELKSDMIALSSFRLYADGLLRDGMLERIYSLTFAEMLRYMRRGDLLAYPDSASAYLAWRYFEQSGAIEYDSDSKKYKMNAELLEASVFDFTLELLDIFKNGDVQAARSLVRRFGSMENTSENDPFPKACPEVLSNVLKDSDIAYYIEYDFQEM